MGYREHGLADAEDAVLGGFDSVGGPLYLNQIYYWRAISEPDPARKTAVASLKRKGLVQEDPTAPDDAILLTIKGRRLYNIRAKEEEAGPEIRREGSHEDKL